MLNLLPLSDDDWWPRWFKSEVLSARVTRPKNIVWIKLFGLVWYDMICIHAIAFIDWKGHIFPSHSTQSSFWGHQYLNRNLGPAAPFEKSLFKFLRHLCICEQPSKWWLTCWWIGKIRGQSLQVQVCVPQLHKAWVGKCLFEKMRWWTPQVWEKAKKKFWEEQEAENHREGELIVVEV